MTAETPPNPSLLPPVTYPVHPTSIVKKTETEDQRFYADIAMSGLFNACIININGQRQVIWQRYNIMLLANAAILTFFTRSQPPDPTRAQTTDPAPTAFAIVFGFLLCVFWRIMHGNAWGLFNMLVKEVAGFSWDGVDRKINPMVIGWLWRGNTKGRWVYRVGNWVIYMFMIVYVGFGVYYQQELKAAVLWVRGLLGV